MTSKKVIKDDNPALDFITLPGQQEMRADGTIAEIVDVEDPKQGQKSTNTAKKTTGLINKSTGEENRTKRLQLVLQPSLVKALQNAAWEKHQSVNAYIEELIKKELDV